MLERYEAVFYDIENGYFTVPCRGYFKHEAKSDSMLPTVEEAKEEYFSNAQFIGIK